MKENYNVLSKSRDTLLKNFKVSDLSDTNQLQMNGKKNSKFLGLLLIITFLFSYTVNAQVNGYAFSQSTGTYTPITGGTILGTANATTGAGSLDDIIYNLPASTIPFSFTFDGAPYTGLNISTNGFLTFGATAPASSGASTGYTPLSAATGYSGAIAAFGRDLNSLNNILGNIGEIRYQTVGSAPNQEFVVQWKNFRPWSSSTSTTIFWRWNFQIRLHQNGTINIVYDSNVLGAAAASTIQVGLRGPNNTFSPNLNNRTITSGTHTWDTSINGTANSSTCAFSTTLLPADGKTFTWTPAPPPACPAPAALNATAVGITNATLNWNCIACTGTFRVEYNTTPATFGGVGNIVVDPATSGLAISGLTGSTNYTFFVRQDCGGAGFSTVSSANFTTAAPGEDCTTAATIAVAANLGASVNTLLTTGLTSDGPNGTCSNSTGNPSKRDRWVKFVAPSSGNKVIITTSSGSISDALMQVWSACPAVGSALGCSDDVIGAMPQLEFCSLTGGATYYVQVWPYSDTAGNFNIKIYEDIVCPVPPANDECAGVETIIVGAAGSCPGAATSGTTVNATASAGITKTTCDAFGNYNDVFYKFNSGANTSLNFSFTNLTGTNEFGIYTDCGITYGGICSSSSLSTTITGLTASTDYYIVVWANSAGVAGTFSICISTPPVPVCVASPTAPANGSTTVNPCAVTLSWPSVAGASSYDVYFDLGAGPAVTLVSPAQAGTSYVAGLLAATTAYSWRIVPKNGSGDAVGCSDFTFTTTGAPACTTLTAPADVSTICAGPTTFTWAAAAGATTYDVYLDTVLVSDNQTGTSYSQTVTAGAHAWSIVPSNCIGDAVGCVDFTFTANASPAGDVFATAIDLGVISASTTASGDNQTSNCWRNDYTSASTPGSFSARAGNDVFYKFEITECGSLMDIGTCTSSFDTYIQLLNSAGTRINGDDDACSAPNSAGSFLSTLALAPGVYYVVVEGFNAADMGTFTLDLTYVAGTPQITYYQDIDADGFGNSAVSQMACSLPVGYVTDSSDCNDNQIQYADLDADGFGSTTQVACGVTNNTDCDDNQVRYADVDLDTFGSMTVKVACGGVTNNTDCNDNQIQYFDGDTDNYGTAVQVACGAAATGDCNDAVSAINPGATDVCLDGIDNDCNGNIDNVGLPGGCVPVLTTLPTATCGSTISSLAVTITASYVVGAQGYRFRVKNLTTNVVQIVDRPVNSFALTGLPGTTFGTPYEIDVALKFAGVWQPFYGAACTVNTPSPLCTIGAQCNSTLTAMSQFVFCTFVPSVTGYRFRVTKISDSSVQIFDSGLNRFTFNQLPNRSFNAIYSVEVALKNTDGTYLPYNTGCNISSPSFPTSEVRLSQCDYNALSNTESFVATLVAGATEYRIIVYNLGLGYSYTIDRPVNTFNLNMFPGLTAGTTYSVQVAVKIGGIFGPFGKVCNVTTPGGTRMIASVKEEFKAIASPNPFAEDFRLEVKTSNESTIQIRVYDMLGKLIENKNVEVSEMENLGVGSNYPSGVYNIIVSQGENTQTLRVIKR